MAEGLRRGQIVIAATPRDYGKPRPALVVQSDLLNATHASLIVCPLTTDLIDAPAFRLDVEPSAENGLRSPSQIMIDKMTAIPREKIGAVIGSLSDYQMGRVNRSLYHVLGLGLRVVS